MLTQVGIAPFDVYLDCKATLDILLGSPGSGAEARSPRGHMWSPFWAAFEGRDIQAHQTLAHATRNDIEAGRTTVWDKKG
eukprot:4335679-Pyramimonas_sp.AAC.1